MPWCTIGDMNNIASQADKKGGAAYPQWLLDGFNDMLEEVGLKDMKLYGHSFTWERGRGMDAWLEIRLDRAMVTSNWFELFPYSKLYNLEGSPSDHSAICLEPSVSSPGLRKKRFRFENVWLTEPLCRVIVRENWESNGVSTVQQKIQ